MPLGNQRQEYEFRVEEKTMNDIDATIVANGTFPNHPIPLRYLENAQYVVCCDGAANDFIARGGKPDAIVGDCDSISAENKIRFADILHPNPDQETNDLTKAVRFCIKRGKKNIAIVGATGRREDHTLGNISLLAEYLNEANPIMITNYGIFTPIAQTTKFESFRGQQVSVFTIKKTTQITSHNLKYPLTKLVLANWWQGTLNESTADTFTIETNGTVIVFQVFSE